jgi:hypothetical protein
MQGTTQSIPNTGDVNIRYAGDVVSDYYVGSGIMTGFTDDKLYDVTSYDINNPFIPNFDVLIDQYLNYQNQSIDGRTRVIQNDEPMIYTLDANNDADIGTINQDTGILYTTYTGITRESNNVLIPQTDFRYKGEGWNETNVSLSALSMDEYLFGITSAPEVQSDVFIERGATTVMEMHLKMSEVESLEHLVGYGNGFYKIRKI